MKVKVGKVLPDGRIRHIEVFYEGESEATIFTLKNFYVTDKRIDALLDLGNVHRLHPSPYGRWQGHEDKVHCDAAIRDNGDSKKQNESRISANKEEFVMLTELCYLYENGKWTVHIGKRYSESIDFHALLDIIKWHPFSGLEVYEFNKENTFSQTYFSDWNDMLNESKSLYVFRGNRLVKTINHPLQKNKVA